MRTTAIRLTLAIILISTLASAIIFERNHFGRASRIRVTAYFANTTGLYPGDEVRVLGVPVGEIDTITPMADRAKVTFWFDSKYPVPANADATILALGVVSARVIQLSPAYTGGPAMTDGTVIALEHTAVPLEYDDLRTQLEKLNLSLQPTEPGGVAPAGAVINTAADNLRGQGANIRQTLIALAQALSAIGDHSGDIAATVTNLSTLVSALSSSADLLAQLNGNLAQVTALLSRDPDSIGAMVKNLDSAVADVQGFITANRDTLGTTFDKLSSLTTALNDRLPELKQILHVSPTELSNFANVYRPTQASLAGAFAVVNFANPLQFICGNIQAASRMNYEQSAKLCVQYLAPIIKNREYNFPPVGTTLGLAGLPITGEMARPNEITYSQDWLRPDHIPGAPESPPAGAPANASAGPIAPPAAAVDPGQGLAALMAPGGSGTP